MIVLPSLALPLAWLVVTVRYAGAAVVHSAARADGSTGGAVLVAPCVLPWPDVLGVAIDSTIDRVCDRIGSVCPVALNRQPVVVLPLVLAPQRAVGAAVTRKRWDGAVATAPSDWYRVFRSHPAVG